MAFDRINPIDGKSTESLLSQFAALYLNLHLPANHVPATPDDFAIWTKSPDGAGDVQDVESMQRQLMSIDALNS